MRRHLTLLILASSLTFLAGLGRGAIGDSDEAFYAEAAREMVESGDWVTPRYNYEDRFQKPILYYWLASLAFLVSGPGEAAARLPSALSGVLLVLLTYWAGRRLFGPRVGLVAGLVTTGNFGYFVLGRLALPDLPLASLMTLATWSGLESSRLYSEVGAGGASIRRARRLLWLASAAAALAFLMKGPVGVVLPAIVIVLSALLGLTGPRRVWPFPPAALAPALLIFLAVALPWFVAMADAHGLAYLYRFFVAENVERFATDRYNEPRSLLFYVPIVFGGFAPWSPFLLLGLAPVFAFVRRRAVGLTRTHLLLVIWAAVPFVFYSLSIGKQPRYILPMLPPLALLLADGLCRRLEADTPAASGRSRAVAWLGTVAGVMLVVVGLLLLRAAPLLALVSTTSSALAGTAIIGAGILVALTSWLRPRALPGVVAVAAIVSLLGLHLSVFSDRGTEPVERMAAAYATAREANEPSGTHRAFVRNLVFYTRVRQTDLPAFEDLVRFLERPERVLGIIRERDLERLRREAGLEPIVLFSLRYFNAAGLRVMTLLSPDPDQDLETVHLVTNRPR